ncbi:MAG: HD domain-containing protein [Bacteroidetes bacterium]|nr:HD domain-containing protein [Bacteroidota bacterium]
MLLPQPNALQTYDNLFKKISSIAENMDLEVYLIGGFVRDMFLMRESKDIDIVVVGSGIKFAKEVSQNLQNSKFSFFQNFGTAQVVYNDLVIEFVGARKESYERNSRKPFVEEGTLQDDQERRDLTINAISISLNKKTYGSIIDPFNGLQDLENQIIKTPLDSDTTFSDDPLRMMRAIRFATQLGFKINDKTYEGIFRNKERISIISQERITDELNKIILSPMPSIGFEYLFDTGLLHLIFHEMVALHGVETINGKSHKDNFYHTLQVLDNVCKISNDLWLRWAAILHDIAKPATKKFEQGNGWTFHGHEDKGSRMVKPIFTRLRLPQNEKMRFVEKLVLLHLRPIVLSQNEVTDSAIRRLMVEAGEDLDALIMLCNSDITSKNEKKIEKVKQNFALVQSKIKDVEEKDNLRNWQPPINGNHILEHFEILKPYEVGLLKNILREAILDGIVKDNFEDALSFLKQVAEQKGIKILK